jgi:hypothetical protein
MPKQHDGRHGQQRPSLLAQTQSHGVAISPA